MAVRESDSYLTSTPEGRSRDKRYNNEAATRTQLKALHSNHRIIAMCFAMGMSNRETQKFLADRGVSHELTYISNLRNNDLVQMRVHELQSEQEERCALTLEKHSEMAEEALELLGTAVSEGVVSRPLIDPTTCKPELDENGDVVMVYEPIDPKDRLSAAKTIASTHEKTAPVSRTKSTVEVTGPSREDVDALRERMNVAAIETRARPLLEVNE